jgi:hypothetical protein
MKTKRGSFGAGKPGSREPDFGMHLVHHASSVFKATKEIKDLNGHSQDDYIKEFVALPQADLPCSFDFLACLYLFSRSLFPSFSTASLLYGLAKHRSQISLQVSGN